MLTTLLLCTIFSSILFAGVVCYSLIWLKMPMYHPFFIYLLYHFLGFIMRPISIYQNGWSFLWTRIGFVPGSDDILRTTLVSSAALLAAFAGVIVSCRNRPIEKMPVVTLNVGRPLGFYICLMVLTAAGIYASYKSFGGAGLDTVLAYNVNVQASGVRSLDGISGYQTALAETLPILCIMLFLIPKLRLFTIAFITVFVAFRFYAGAQRLSFVVVAAAIFMIVIINAHRRYPKLLPVIGLLCFAFVFDVIGSDRFAFRQLLYGTTDVDTIISNYFTQRGDNVGTSDIVEFDVSTATMSVIDNYSEYSYGSQYLRILIWPIPRQLWPNKPVITNIVEFNDYGDYRFLTKSLYSDLYMNIGFLLVPVGLFFLGMFQHGVYKLASRTNKAIAYMFFWVVLMYMKTVLRDGGVMFLYFWATSMATVTAIVWAGKIQVVREDAMSRFRAMGPVLARQLRPQPFRTRPLRTQTGLIR